MQIKAAEIAEIIKLQIKNYREKIIRDDKGVVLRVSDGIAHISGLEGCMANEMLEFDGGAIGMALNLEEKCVAAALLGTGEGIKEGSIVRSCGNILSVPAGEGLLGRVVDALGNPIDGKGPVRSNERRTVEAPAPGIMQRKRVNRPLETGIKAIDSMIPIGKGQRELIIGDRQTGKTAIAVDAMIHQRGKDVICIYVAVGQKQSSVARIAQMLETAGAMEYSIIISAPASSAAALEYIAPYSGCAMAEYFMYRGKDVLIIYDDLSKHAAAYRALSLLLRRPPGREAYPGDIFYLHSRLLERAAQLSDEAGGGSITALPIIETQSGDVSAYIPTNVISITDGQIFLESEFFHSGIRPAVNPGISVSRVGGSAQLPAMRKVSGKLKIMYSQYQELKSFAQFGAELDPDTRRRMDNGRRIAEVFRQNRNSAVPVEKQVVVMYALVNGYLDQIDPSEVSRYEGGLYRFLDSNCREILHHIREGGSLGGAAEDILREALLSYEKKFAKTLKEENHVR